MALSIDKKKSKRTKKLDLPTVKDSNISIRAISSGTTRRDFQNLVNNKCTLRILIATFFDSNLHIIIKFSINLLLVPQITLLPI